MSADLVNLLSHPGSAPIIFYHHPHHPSFAELPELPKRCHAISLDTIEHFTPRMIYCSGIRQLGLTLASDITTWDGFARALREAWATRSGDSSHLSNGVGESSTKRSSKGKEKAPNGMVNGDFGPAGKVDGEQIVILISHAERLRSVFGGNWSVVTRLAELTGVPATVVLCSSIPWDELRPPRGDAPEPVQVYLPAPTKEEIIKVLSPASRHPLFPRFLDLLLATLLPLLPYPLQDLEYLAEPLWQIYTSRLPPLVEQTLLKQEYADPDNPPPPLQITVKLLTDLKHQVAIPLAAAIEDLLTGQVGRDEFVQSMLSRSGQPRSPSTRSVASEGLKDIPICGKFLLVAAYCASYNPAKSDLRLFGRGTGPEGKRKRGGGTRRTGYGRTRIGKIPQRLLGPKPFPLDRLLAMFASLYAEHATRPIDLEPSYDYSSDDDGDHWLPSVEQARKREERRRERDTEREELWEDEVDHLTMSIGSWSMIPDLETQGLLRRVSPVDRLDNVMLRCEVDYDTVKSLAKDVKVTLDEYLYETTA